MQNLTIDFAQNSQLAMLLHYSTQLFYSQLATFYIQLHFIKYCYLQKLGCLFPSQPVIQLIGSYLICIITIQCQLAVANTIIHDFHTYTHSLSLTVIHICCLSQPNAIYGQRVYTHHQSHGVHFVLLFICSGLACLVCWPFALVACILTCVVSAALLLLLC